MYHLHVEELEPRQMLNGTGFCPPSPRVPTTAAGACAPQAAERAPSVDHGGHADPGGPDRPADRPTEPAPSRSLPSRVPGSQPSGVPGASAPPPQSAGASPETRILIV